MRRRASPRAARASAPDRRRCSDAWTSRSAQIAEHWKDAGFFLYLGRHIGLPVCLEGALKLKEISYIPTDAYAAGEMKHGPIALLDEATPVVCVATDSPVLDKVLSNIAEVRARGAHVIAVATEGNDQVDEHAEEVVEVPRTDWFLQPILAVIPLQLLAYHIARGARPERGPAAQPREDRHRRVTRAWVGIDLLEVERLERALERRPRLADRLFTAANARTPSARSRPAHAPRRPLLREGGGGQGAGPARPGASATWRWSRATGAARGPAERRAAAARPRSSAWRPSCR